MIRNRWCVIRCRWRVIRLRWCLVRCRFCVARCELRGIGVRSVLRGIGPAVNPMVGRRIGVAALGGTHVVGLAAGGRIDVIPVAVYRRPFRSTGPGGRLVPVVRLSAIVQGCVLRASSMRIAFLVRTPVELPARMRILLLKVLGVSILFGTGWCGVRRGAVAGRIIARVADVAVVAPVIVGIVLI